MAHEIPPGILKAIHNYIYRESGIFLENSRQSILTNAVAIRLRELPNLNPESYLELLKRDAEEKSCLLDHITTNFTKFFRNQRHYQTFTNYVIPKLLQTRPDQHIRLWSAGCSTGEEPFTNAMILRECLPPGWTIEIIATDISQNALKHAKAGHYTAAKVKDIPGEYLQKYFHPISDHYTILDSIKKLVKFSYHNLKDSSPYRNFDVVFCRNVLIYFDQKAQKHAMKNIWGAMRNPAFLFIGHAESLLNMGTSFEFLKTSEGSLYVKNTSDSSRL